ncbi:MAG: phosphoribosylformylglycinamidine synthase subunit PurS [Bacteroidota bacterium]
MKYKATVQIMPRKEILDPQGKATLHGLQNLGFDQVDGVRIGKRIELELNADDTAAANAFVEEACRKLLTNMVIEEYVYEVEAVE